MALLTVLLVKPNGIAQTVSILIRTSAGHADMVSDGATGKT